MCLRVRGGRCPAKQSPYFAVVVKIEVVCFSALLEPVFWSPMIFFSPFRCLLFPSSFSFFFFLFVETTMLSDRVLLAYARVLQKKGVVCVPYLVPATTR